MVAFTFRSLQLDLIVALRFPSTVQSRPGEGFYRQSAATFLTTDCHSEASD